MSQTVLVIAAHPDDEVLGCGGAIARHAARSDRVHVAILAQGLYSRGEPTDAEVAALRSASEKASAILRVASLDLLDYPDNRMDTVARLDVTQTVEQLIATHRPSVVYTHWAGDVNVDHRRIHEAVVTACRPQPGHPVETLLFFEIASSTEWQPPGSAAPFLPNWFIDISATLDAKLSALQAYAAEMRPWPHARSLQAVEHLARWRGASVGYEAAEAFVLGRQRLGQQ
ncbi:PIG-L deacetylase family protein [Andreprevotia chitinilytica]|uniref:PIG-L deacetylase family protein n=1 Tax=Andreprevotia chitinilytica TaxID=396808 RepID=UPI00054E7225|nr:PIG-L deacetylase family protein [Andreprevotia chitinilytica]